MNHFNFAEEDSAGKKVRQCTSAPQNRSVTKRRQKQLYGNSEAETLSSPNRTIQSKTEHYLEKCHCRKENNLDDVMEVFNSKEHTGQHSF